MDSSNEEDEDEQEMEVDSSEEYFSGLTVEEEEVDARNLKTELKVSASSVLGSLQQPLPVSDKEPLILSPISRNRKDRMLQRRHTVDRDKPYDYDFSSGASVGGGKASTAAAAARTRTSSQNPVDDIRNATAKYIQGELSLTEFAAAVEDYEKYSDEEEGDSAVPPSEAPDEHPSLVLVKPEVEEVNESGISVKQEGLDGEEEDPLSKLKGEFFRTGSDTATFTIRRKRKMPPTIKSMMGEAHVRYARGDLLGAESICLEVVKEQPTYKDPFHTLAMIYESQGRVQKSLQFFLICALLDPKHFDDWPRLADLSVEEENLPQAIMCLNKAIVVDSSNIKLFIRRSELLAEVGDYKNALKGYHKVLQLVQEDDELFMDVSKHIASVHFKNNELEQAYDALSNAVNKFSERVTTTELNLLIEVCISLKKYVKAVTLYMRFSGVKFDPPVPKPSFRERNSLMVALNESNRRCSIPIGLHADLIQKLCIVLIHLEAFEMVEPIVFKLWNTETIDGFGLQFYEIAEAYIAKLQYTLALSILDLLVKHSDYSKAEIWLRYAECLFLLDRVEESADAYSKVIELAPGHKIARLNLSVILQRLGKFDVALQSLDQNEMEHLIDQDLLIEKCNILQSRNRIPEFYEAALELFSRHCPEIRNLEEVQVLAEASASSVQLEALKLLRVRRGELVNDDLVLEEKSKDNLSGEWKVYINLLDILLKMDRPDLFSRVTNTVWASKLFATDIRTRRDKDLHCAFASVLRKDSEMTPIHTRVLFGRYAVAPIMLNLFSLAFRKCGHTRYSKHIVRLLMKNPNDTRLMMLSANNSFVTGTYKYALMEYLALLKLLPGNPLIHLMIASTLIHIGSQKSTSNRTQLMIHGMTFIHQYAELKGDCQETFYNLGRFYHYLGMYRQAMMYYKRTLLTPPVEDRTNENFNISDLSRDAAFNIAQIYKANNCWELAREYIHRYITI